MAKKTLKLTSRELNELNKEMQGVITKLKATIDYFSLYPEKQALFEPILKEACKVSDHIYRSTCNTVHEIEIETDGE